MSLAFPDAIVLGTATGRDPAGLPFYNFSDIVAMLVPLDEDELGVADGNTPIFIRNGFGWGAQAHSQHPERRQYEVTRTEPQCLRVDPDNRLVTGTLETRWNTALTELKRAEQAMVHHPEPPRPFIALSQELQTAFKAIGQHL